MVTHKFGVALCDPFSARMSEISQCHIIPIVPRIALEYGIILPQAVLDVKLDNLLIDSLQYSSSNMINGNKED